MSGLKLNYHNESNYEYFTVKNILPVNEYKTAEFELEMFKKLFLPPTATNSATNEDGTFLKKNSGVFLTQILSAEYRHASCLLSANIKVLQEFIKYVDEKLFHSHSSFGNLSEGGSYSTLLSGYQDGDYYSPHRDCCVATLIWWLTEPEEPYEGGELVLPDLSIEIKPESYTGIIIPSWYRHEVRPIKSGSNDFVRYALSSFIDIPKSEN